MSESIELKEKSEEILNELTNKVSTLPLTSTGFAYHRLYTTLQLLHMQGEHTAVIELGLVLNRIL